MSRSAEALEAIKAKDDLMIRPEDVAPVLGVNPQSIRLQAEENPGMLGFRVSRIGARTLIPRIPFISWVEGASA